jgi:hypothetical protein
VAVVDFDLPPAELLGHTLLAGHGVLVQSDPLPGHDPLLHYRLLFAQHDLVLLLGELRTGGGGVEVALEGAGEGGRSWTWCRTGPC